MEASELVDAVYAAIEAVQPLYGDSINRIVVQGAADSRPVRVARPLLLAALQTLIDNAMRYAPADTSITIQSETQSNDTLQISVLDEGTGMDTEGRIQAVNRLRRGNIKRSEGHTSELQ